MLQELGVENVPGDLEEPLELGYYYSYCGINKWKDTGVRSQVTFCCQGGISVDCQTITSQLEDQTGPGQEQSSGKNPAKSLGVAGLAGPGSTTDIVAAPSDSSSASGVIDNLKVGH